MKETNWFARCSLKSNNKSILHGRFYIITNGDIFLEIVTTVVVVMQCYVKTRINVQQKQAESFKGVTVLPDETVWTLVTA